MNGDEKKKAGVPHACCHLDSSCCFTAQKHGTTPGPIRIILISVMIVIAFANGCARPPQNGNISISFAFSDTQDTTIGRRVKELSIDHKRLSGFRLLGNGLDAFVGRTVLAHTAERSIDVQYYLYHDDMVG